MTDTLVRTIDTDNYQELITQIPSLSPRQQAFLFHYFNDANLNATEAAKLAGYECTSYMSFANVGSDVYQRLMPYVRALMHANGLDVKETVSRISDLARATIDDVTEVDEETGEPVFNFVKARERGRMHTVKAFKKRTRTRRRGSGENAETDIDTEVEVVLHDSLEALDKLAKIHKLFPERNPINAVQVNVNAQAPAQSREELVERLRVLAAGLGYGIYPLDAQVTEVTGTVTDVE